ncbi:hypothetical protein O4H61_08990 [Roseovarius aestuarii]|nr:hypothetical protein [Roseovarius aestuarii]
MMIFPATMQIGFQILLTIDPQNRLSLTNFSYYRMGSAIRMVKSAIYLETVERSDSGVGLAYTESGMGALGEDRFIFRNRTV